MILHFGGSFFLKDNVRNVHGLEYLTDAVKAFVFGFELYPGIFRKAAYYMHSIISNHIFFDGNKRTGLGVAILFLERNNYQLDNTVDQPQLIDFALETAKGLKNIDQIEEWLGSIYT